MSNPLDFEKPIQELESKIKELSSFAEANQVDLKDEIAVLESKLASMKRDVYANLTPWQRVKIARLQQRPTTMDYIKILCKDYIEFHGDRLYGDDPAIVGGIGTIEGRVYTIIGHQKGKDTKENLKRNFGMPHPEGYRKALRLMKQAEKFKRPILFFIDTPGAYCGLGAEERGQGEAIAKNLMEMAALKTPIICIVIGEGGSGGALALGVGDRVCMLESSVYSVISPEGLSSILWKDAALAEKAANIMKLTADDLMTFSVIDAVVNEPVGGAHNDPQKTAQSILEYIQQEIPELQNKAMDQLLEERYQKLRRIGTWA